MNIEKIKERISLGGPIGESPDIPLGMLCDEVQRNRTVLTKLIAWQAQKFGQENAENLINELDGDHE